MSKKSPAAIAQTVTATANRFDAFTVRDYELAGEKKADWNKVGVAFPHSDGKGYNVVLHALPVDGKLVLRLHEPKEDSAE